MSKRERLTITDELGRKIVIQTMSLVEQARMIRAIGPRQSGNSEYAAMVQAACLARSIDEKPLPFPVDEAGVDANLKLLDDEGFVAIWAWLERETKEALERARSAQEEPAPDPLVPSAT